MNWYNVLEGLLIWVSGTIFTALLIYLILKFQRAKNIYKIKKSFIINNISHSLAKRIDIGYIIVRYGDSKIINSNRYCYFKYKKDSKDIKVTYKLPIHKNLGTYFKFYIKCKNEEDMSKVKTVLIKNNKFRNINSSLSLINNKSIYFLLDEYINDEVEKRKGIKYNYIYPI